MDVGRPGDADPVDGGPVGRRRVIPYPTDHLLAVVDDPADAPDLVAALLSAGFGSADVTVLGTDGGAGGIGSLGDRHPRWTRLLRVVQFLTMDQMPDLVLYEAALRDGRVVAAVHVRERARMLVARDLLRGRGAHFLNYFGRTATEELERWRGPELELPALLRH